MKPFALKTRVALWAGVLIAIGMCICGVAILGLTYRNEMLEYDTQLRAEADGFFDEWQRHGGIKFPLENDVHEVREWLSTIEPERLVEVAKLSGEVIYRSDSLQGDWLHRDGPGLRNLDVAGRQWRYGGFVQDGVILRLTADLAPFRTLTHTTLLAFAVAVPLLLLFVGVSSPWAARYALEPVRRIADAAERVTADKPYEPAPVPEPNDEVRRLALVLNDTFARLRQSFLQAQRFSADASHELKTPLTIQRTAIEALLESPEFTPAQHEAIGSLLEQTKRLSSITESLLLLSRADAGRLGLDLTEQDVSEIVGACVEDARILAEPAQLAIEAEVPARLRATVDGARLSQILLNLLDNAVKYNHPHGRIRVSVARSAEGLSVSVSNSGPGISPEHASQLFDRFFRADSTGEKPGYGLGLSLARELTLAHRGTLRLVRSDAEWTEFRLTLP